MSDKLAESVDLLHSVQLGGVSDIAPAMAYCESLVVNPSRTVIALISDFEKGGSLFDLLRCVRRLAEARTRLIGLVALDTNGAAVFNRSATEKLAGLGMHVAAMTPDRFSEWLVGIMD